MKVYQGKQYFDYICIMKERLNMVLEEYGLNSSRLAEKMGIQRSGISHIMAGRNKPSFDFIVGLLELFPELDANWLLTGEGSMLKDDNAQESTVPPKTDASAVNKQPDLFTNIPQDIPAKTEKTGKYKLQGDPKSNKREHESEVYKSKQSEDTADYQVESVLILLSNGKFKTYRPE